MNGMDGFGMEWNGMEWIIVIWNGMEDMEWNGILFASSLFISNGMEWNGMDWNAE